MNNSPSPIKHLRQALLVLATFLLAGSAHAEWVSVGRNENFRIYLDQQLIRRDGDLAQTWQMMDFTAAQWEDPQTVVWSIKTLVEYDCSQPRFRNLGGEAYSEQMGVGKLVASEQIATPAWEGVEPNSAADQIRLLACGKKK